MEVNQSHNTPEYSVSELSKALKRNIEDAFSYVRISGEVSGFKRHTSGHLYFTLKDNNAVISAVCWRGIASRIDFALEDGLEVVATGKITIYEGRSNYQIVCERIELAGQGALMALLEKRKKQYIAEGLFAEQHKKPLPFMPQTIGVITSETGAVIRDIMHRISDRFPVRVLLKAVAVQGDTAKNQVASAINEFNSLQGVSRPEIIIVARGGGSVEDLWAFNEDEVVRATFNSEIPIISAVGHETDTTLIDFVSDKRAPTPTAAAEIAIPNRMELLAYVSGQGSRLTNLLNNVLSQADRLLQVNKSNLRPPRIEEKEQKIDDLFNRLKMNALRSIENKEQILTRLGGKLITPTQRVDSLIDRLNNNVGRLNFAFKSKISNTENRLSSSLKMMSSLSYQNVLKRGFAIVKNEDGKLLSTAKLAKEAQVLSLEFSDGELKVGSSSGIVSKPKKQPAKQAKVKGKKDQFNLFG